MLHVRVSQSDVLFHVLNSSGVGVNLLLHGTLVFLQVGQSLLQMQVLLLLVGNCLVVSVAYQLQFGHNVRHIVLVHCLKHVPHLLNLSSVKL